MKKPFKVYYFLLYEGHTEFVIFSYLKNRFRGEFSKSNIIFSDKTDYSNNGETIVFRGKLGGIGGISNFNSKYNVIKLNFPERTFLIFLDNDLDDSSKIKEKIEKNGDIVQLIEYNSEYLLLKLSGYGPKEPGEFKDLKTFRDYCKSEFLTKFGKEASRINDFDLDGAFQYVSDDKIKEIFSGLFSILNK